MRNYQKRFRMEKLEDRQMMAGDIAVQFSNGTLSITEAPLQAGDDNTVVVSMQQNGNLRVFGGGVDQQFDPTLIEDVDINLGGGSDTLLFNADLTEEGVPNFRSYVYINMGMDDAAISTSPFGELADIGAADYVELTGCDIQGLVQIEGRIANDFISVQDSTIMGDGLLVNSGSGTDLVDVERCELAGLVIQTYQGAGTEWHADHVEIRDINVDKAPASRVQVSLGGGDDIFHLENVNAVNVNINAGLDNDTGTIVNVGAVDELMARMGDGNDSLTLRGVVTDRLTALGEAGTNDRLTMRSGMTNTNVYNTSTITGWESIDGMRQFSFRNETPRMNLIVKRRVFGG